MMAGVYDVALGSEQF